jgi:hypothetical protein
MKAAFNQQQKSNEKDIGDFKLMIEDIKVKAAQKTSE